MKRKKPARKTVARRKPLVLARAKKVISKPELEEIKYNIRLVKSELNPAKKGLIFGEQSKFISVNVPAAAVQGLYDAYLPPQRRKVLKARARELIEKINLLEQRKYQAILQGMTGVSLPLEAAPKSLSSLIDQVGSELFVKRGTALVFYENQFVRAHQKDFKSILSDLLSFSQTVLRSVRKR